MNKKELQDIFTKNLRYYLEKSNKTQVDLIHDLQFSAGIVSEWMNGKKYPRMDRIDKLANYFQVPKSFLIEDMTIPVYTSYEQFKQKKENQRIYSQQNVDFACCGIVFHENFIEAEDLLLIRKEQSYSKHSLILYKEHESWSLGYVLSSIDSFYQLTSKSIKSHEVIGMVIEIRKTHVKNSHQL